MFIYSDNNIQFRETQQFLNTENSDLFVESMDFYVSFLLCRGKVSVLPWKIRINVYFKKMVQFCKLTFQYQLFRIIDFCVLFFMHNKRMT